MRRGATVIAAAFVRVMSSFGPLAADAGCAAIRRAPTYRRFTAGGGIATGRARLVAAAVAWKAAHEREMGRQKQSRERSESSGSKHVKSLPSEVELLARRERIGTLGADLNPVEGFESAPVGRVACRTRPCASCRPAVARAGRLHRRAALCESQAREDLTCSSWRTRSCGRTSLSIVRAQVYPCPRI